MSWKPVAQWKDVQEDGCLGVDCDGTRIAVYAVDDCPFATSDICTHQLAYMSEGFIDGEYIECPLHQGRFHIPTGKAQGAPVTKDIQAYETKVQDGVVFVNFDIPQDTGE